MCVGQGIGYVVAMNMTSNPLRLAVFDCDGTLVDSQGSIVAAMYAACDHHGFERPSENAVRRVVGLPLEVAIARVLDVSSRLSLDISETYKSFFLDSRQAGQVSEPMFDGLHDVLNRLDVEQWLMGIATGKSSRGLLRTLEHHDLTDRFVTRQTADSALGKPNPDMMLKAMSEVGVEPEFTVMIGDTTFDVEMAKNAGVQAIGVAWGYHEIDELMDAGAMTVVHTSDELSATLSALMERENVG